MWQGAPCGRAGRHDGRGRKADGGAATCAACAVPGDASQAWDGDGDGGSPRKSRSGGNVAARAAPWRARGRGLCAAAALSRLRSDCRRRPAILPAMLVLARFPRRPCLYLLLDSFAGVAAGRADRVRCLPRQPAAIRRRARRSRLWHRRADCGVAPQIWAADRACPVDGAADGAATRGAGRAGRYVAGARSVASLAALVARLQSGGTGGRRTGADQRHAARPSPAPADAGDGVAARQGATGTRTHRRRGVRTCIRREIARGGPASGAGRRCPRQRRHIARRGEGAKAQRRGAGFGAHLGQSCSRCRDERQHI